VVATSALAWGAAVTPAMAQEDGVFYDSDDAAGKEYAIPTEEARRGGKDREDDPGAVTGGGGGGDSATPDPDAGTGAGGSEGSDEPRAGDGAPLFGTGISPKGRTADSTALSSGTSRSAIDRAGSGTSPVMWTAGLVLLVLLLGGGGAFAVRRRQQTA
jgi:hypothetical protein